jgi:hypothetical protein
MWEKIDSFTHAHLVEKGNIVSQIPESTSDEFIITAIAAGHVALTHTQAIQDAKCFPIDGLHADAWWLKKQPH